MLGRWLHGLGVVCVRFRWIVLAAWVALAIGITVLVGQVGAVTNNDLSLPGTDSQAAFDVLQEYFPPQQNGSNPVVFHTTSGRLDDGGANENAISQTVLELQKTPHVVSATDPFDQPAAGLVSADGTYAFIPVLLDVNSGQLDETTAETIYDVGTTRGLAAGMQVAVGGPVGSTLSQAKTESSEVIGLVAAMIILAFTFGTLVAMGLPIVTAILGLMTGLGLIGLLGHLIDIPSVGPTLATMIGLGVGIDYALFLVTKHRAQVHRHGMPIRDSIAEAVATSGGAILFAGITVVIALLALSVAQIPFVSSLGYACAVGVFTAVLAALTLLPALLAVLGGGIERARIPFLPKPVVGNADHGFWGRWAGIVSRHPFLSCVIAFAILIPLIIPVFTLRLGQVDVGVLSTKTTARQAFDLMSDGFGPGYNGPLVVSVLMDPPAKASDAFTAEYDKANAMKDELEAQQKILNQQADDLKKEQAALERQKSKLEAQKADLESQKQQLLAEQSSLQQQQSVLLAKKASLQRQAHRVKLRGAHVQAKANRLKQRLVRLMTLQGQYQAQLQQIEAKIAATVDPATLAELQALKAKVIADGGVVAIAIKVTGVQLLVLKKRGEHLKHRAATLTREGEQLKRQGESLQQQANALQAQANSLQQQANTLQKQADELQREADDLQRRADALNAQKDALLAEQDEALALQDDLTKQLTKAGGDERGTDLRIVQLQDALAATPGVQRVVQPLINEAGNAVVLSTIATTRPADPATATLVGTLRDSVIPSAIDPTMQVDVGGSTAANVDLAALIGKKLPLVVLTVIALSCLLLLLAFRSLMIPLQAAITNLLSAAASFGVVTAVFQWGWGLDLIGLPSPYGTVPIASYVPLMMFAALFGLSMDYEVFFISHVQGLHAKGMSHREAVREGLASSAKIIAAAALIMMAVFGSFIIIDDPTIKQFGVGLTIAVALAAFLVLFLAPAMLILFGERTWHLPRFLDRILPDLDLEGNQRVVETTPAAGSANLG